MENQRDGQAWLLAIGAGVALWSAIAYVGGRAEPWDAEIYWSVGYPLSLALSLLFGAAFPERPWRWPLGLTFAQLPVMVAAGSGLNLLPLGLVLLAILSLPAMLAAKLGAALGRRVSA